MLAGVILARFDLPFDIPVNYMTRDTVRRSAALMNGLRNCVHSRVGQLISPILYATGGYTRSGRVGLSDAYNAKSVHSDPPVAFPVKTCRDIPDVFTATFFARSSVAAAARGSPWRRH